MDCRILRQITLKSDGHLGCDDSVGYKIDLGQVSLNPGWRLRNVLNAPIYSHIRSSFARDSLPWKGTCEKCDLFSEHAKAHDTLSTRIDLLVEPTLACELACACCARKGIIAKGRSTNSLDPALLNRLVASCAKDQITIGEINYSGQGEPLMHENFRGLFNAVKTHAPLANQIVTTTGNVDFRSTVGNAALDRLIVSCDGPRQEAYQKYRKGGDLTTVLQFMRDCKQHGDPKVFLEWKYIVFEFSDSDEDLLLAQSIADDIGVDSLLFIITNSKWHSHRFNVNNIRDFPISSSVARVNPSAALSVTACENSHFTPLEGAAVARGAIDICSVSTGKMLNVEGWALDTNGRYASCVELVIDGTICAKGRTVHRRADVPSVHRDAEGDFCGFIFRIPINPEALPLCVVVQISGPGGCASLGGGTNWVMRETGIKTRKDMPAIHFGVRPADTNFALTNSPRMSAGLT